MGDLKNADNILIRDPIKKATMIHNQFDSVFSNPHPPIENDLDPKDRLPDIHHIEINRSGLFKLFLNINSKKADGPDNIPGTFLKICANELVDVYQILFQASLDQGIVPNDWKEANVVPLFKKGDKSKAENYRPISLTSISCKLLEHVVHSNIINFLEKFEVLDDAQHGFQKSRSCISQLTITINDFADCLKNKANMQQTTTSMSYIS